jgi:hypothetical protein
VKDPMAQAKPRGLTTAQTAAVGGGIGAIAILLIIVAAVIAVLVVLAVTMGGAIWAYKRRAHNVDGHAFEGELVTLDAIPMGQEIQPDAAMLQRASTFGPAGWSAAGVGNGGSNPMFSGMTHNPIAERG